MAVFSSALIAGRGLAATSFALALILATATAGASAADMPPRKAGLWEQRVTSSDPNTPATTVQQCTDAASEKAFQQMATSMGQNLCSKNEVRKDGDRWVTESVCTMGPMKITSRSILTGNFDSAYRVESESRFEPAMMGMSGDKSVIEARWVGPCKDGQEPGDIITAEGQKMNILKQSSMMPKMPGR